MELLLLLFRRQWIAKGKVFFIIGQKDEQKLDEDIINKKVLKIIFQDDKEIKIPKINVSRIDDTLYQFNSYFILLS